MIGIVNRGWQDRYQPDQAGSCKGMEQNVDFIFSALGSHKTVLGRGMT